jgi:hypothetical protein
MSQGALQLARPNRRDQSAARAIPRVDSIPLSFFPFHFTAPFPQSVHHHTVSLQGFTPRDHN